MRGLPGRILCCVLALGAGTVLARPYPGKPIRLVLSVGTGGVGDTAIRPFAAAERQRRRG